MAYDLTSIKMTVDLGDTKNVVTQYEALVKTLETKHVKLDIDVSKLQASVSKATKEIEKAYQAEVVAQKQAEEAKQKATKQTHDQAIAYLKQQQQAIKDQYGVNSKLTYNQNPDTKQITSAMITYTNEVGKAEKKVYSLQTAMTSVTAEGEKLKTIQLAPVNQKFTEDMSLVDKQIKQAQTSLDKFNQSMSKKVNTITVGNNGSMAQQLSEFNRLTAKMEQLRNIKIDSSNYDTVQKEIAETSRLYDELTIKIKQVTTTSAEMNRSAKFDDTVTNKIAQYNQKLDELASKYPKLANSSAMEKLRQDAINLSQATPTQFTNGCKQLDLQIRQLQATASQSTGIFARFGASLRSAFSFMSATMIMYKFANEVRQMPAEIKKLDDALVDLKKTTTMTDDELQEFYKESNNIAKSLGVSTEEVINSASAWSRLGYSSKEAAGTMAEVSAIFKSISPDMSMDQANSGLVSTMKAFGIEAEDALDGIASKVNSIGNTMALSNGDIVEFLTRSSSALAESNNTLDQSIAMGSAITEITQDAASAGTLLKTISLRLRGYDEETQAYTINVGELSGEIANLTKTASHPLGVSLFTDETRTEYKSTYQIFKDIKEIYGELNDSQQSDLLEKLTGKRGANVGAALLQNFEAAEKAMNTMADSQGNAMEEMEIIYDSVDYKMNQLKETWIGLTQDLISSDFLKDMADGAIGVLELIDNLGGLAPLLQTILGLVIAIKSQAIATSILNMATGIKNSVSSLVLLAKGLSGAQASLQALSNTATFATAATGGLGLLIAAFGLISSVSSQAKNKTAEFAEAQRKAKEENKILASTYLEQVDGMKSLVDKYGELYDSSSDKVEKDTELKKLQDELIDKYGVEKGAIDLVNGSYNEQLEIIQKLIEDKPKLAQQFLEDDNQAIQSDFFDTTSIFKNENGEEITYYLTNEQNKDLEEISNQIQEAYGGTLTKWNSEHDIGEYLIGHASIFESGVNLGIQLPSSGDIEKDMEDYIKMYQDYIIKMNNTSLDNTEYYNEVKSRLSTLQGLYEDYSKNIEQMKKNAGETDDDVIPDDTNIESTTNQFLAMSAVLESLADNADILQVALNEIGSTDNISTDTMEKLLKKYPELANEITNVETAQVALNKQMALNNIKQAEADIVSLMKIQQELQEENMFTGESLNTITEQFPDLLAHMGSEQELIDAIKGKIGELENAHSEAYRNMMMASSDYYANNIVNNAEMTATLNSQLNELFKSYGFMYAGDSKNWTSLAQGKAEVESELISKLGTAWQNHFKQLGEGFTKISSTGDKMFDNSKYYDHTSKQLYDAGANIPQEAMNMIMNQASKDWDTYNNAMNEIADVFNSIEFDPIDIKVNTSGIGSGGSSGSSGSSAAQKEASYIKSLYNSLVDDVLKGSEEVEKQIEFNSVKLENAILKGDKKTEAELESNISNLLEQQRDKQVAMSKQLNGYLVEMQAKLSKTGLFKDIDINTLSELDIDRVINKIDVQLQKASDSEKTRLETQKSIISDIGSVYVDTLDKREELSKKYWELENERIKQNVENIKDEYDELEKISDRLSKIRDIDRLVLEPDNLKTNDYAAMVELDKQAQQDIINNKKRCLEEVEKYRKQGLTNESAEIKELINQYIEYENARIQGIMNIAQARKDHEIAIAQDDMDILEKAMGYQKDLLDLTIEMLKDETKEKKNALKEQNDDRKDALEDAYNLEKEALNDRLDLIKKEANARKNALDKEKDVKDFNDDVKEKTEEINKIRAEATRLELDNTQGSINKAKELREELAKHEKELADMMYDRNIELQKEAIDAEVEMQEDKIKDELDELEERYEREKKLLEDKYEAQLKKYEDYLNDEGAIRDEANNLIENKTGSFYNRLESYATKYAGMVKSEFQNMWDKAYDGMEKYNRGSTDVISNIENMTDKIINLREEIEKLNDIPTRDFVDGDVTTKDDNLVFDKDSYDKISKDETSDKSEEELTQLENEQKYLHEQMLIALATNNEGLIKWIKKRRKELGLDPETGAILRHQGISLGNLSNLKADEIMVRATKDEWVITNEQYQNAKTNITNMSEALKNQQSSTTGISGVTLNLNFPNSTITKDAVPDMERILKKEITKTLNSVLSKKAIR